MSLIIKNQRIYDFYQHHPQYDFEKMNEFLVDLLERLSEKINPSLDQTFATKLMGQMMDLQSCLLKQQSDNQLNYYKQLTEIRNQYVDELKTFLTIHHNEKIQPLLSQQSEQLFQKITQWQKDNPQWQTSILSLKDEIQKEVQQLSQMSLNKDKLQQFIQNIDERFTQNLTSSQSITSTLLTSTESRLREELRIQQTKLEELSKIGKDQEQMHTQVSDLLRKMDNSSSKGKISETLLNNVLNNLYPMGEIRSVGNTKETGDFMMIRENKPTILFENKNYDKNVGQDEVQKFLRDIEIQQCAGIMLAQNFGIANKSNYEIHLYQGHVCVYLHQVQYNPDKIKIAVDIIDHLSQYMDDSGLKTEEITIDKEYLDQINKEYQVFAQQKINQIKTVKEYSQKLLSQIEEMKLPQLEQWLGKYYSQSFCKENECKYCGFEAKSSGGLTSHTRSCVAKRRIDEILSSGPTNQALPPKPVKPNPFAHSY
jgi:DNA anti-recombination protein RmuC